MQTVADPARMAVLVPALIVFALAEMVTPTTKLVKQLLSIDYDVNLKPSSEQTIVLVTPNAFTLLSMDQQQETIQFSQEFLLKWHDPILGWNRSEVEYPSDWVKLPLSKVWDPYVMFTMASVLPDLRETTFGFSVKTNPLLDPGQQIIDLRHDGYIRTSFPSITTPCPLLIQNFPYDIQHCNVTIGLWMYDKRAVALQASSNLTMPQYNRFEGNSEWELLSIRTPRQRNNLIVTQNQQLYSQLTYMVELKRKPVYYVLVIQAPTFIVATLTIFGIFTPNHNENERREKVTLGVNMFCAITMMLNLVSDMMPKASRLPLLGNYILAEIFVVASAVIVSLVIHCVHRKFHTAPVQPPEWLSRVVLIDVRACFRRRPVAPSSPKKPKRKEISLSPPPDLIPFKVLHNSLAETARLVHHTLLRKQEDADARLAWILILDRIDILFLLIFQMANIIVSAFFMK